MTVKNVGWQSTAMILWKSTECDAVPFDQTSSISCSSLSKERCPKVQPFYLPLLEGEGKMNIVFPVFVCITTASGEPLNKFESTCDMHSLHTQS